MTKNNILFKIRCLVEKKNNALIILDYDILDVIQESEKIKEVKINKELEDGIDITIYLIMSAEESEKHKDVEDFKNVLKLVLNRYNKEIFTKFLGG